MIISLTGKIGSGKDTVADLINQITPYHNWEVKKFAGKLKVIAELLTGVPKANFEDQEFKKQYIGDDWGMTYRDLLQKLGTEAIRTGLHSDAWVNALFSDYKANTVAVGTSEFDFTEEDQIPNWIITDCRFPNELEAVKKRGGVTIKIERDLMTRKGYSTPTEADLHSSETSLDHITSWDYVIDNNSSAEELKFKVKDILENLKLLQYAGL